MSRKLSFMVAMSPLLFAFAPLPKTAPYPKDNPPTQEKIELGKMLFFDPRLSLTGTVSCNSCHNLMAGGEDSRPVSIGIEGKRGGRNSPTVWNSAFMSAEFWDGRAASLEDQAKGPMTNPVEMGMANHDLVVSRLRAVPEYVARFDRAFGKNQLNIDNAAKAIATFERTLITPNSPFDEYLKGNKKAISAAAIRGFENVQKLGCTSCHSGPFFAGPTLPQGQAFFQKFPLVEGSIYDAKYDLLADNGRYEVTKKESDKHLFRVPTWRNVALTAPYFHNGSVSTLSEAVRVMAKTQLSHDLTDKETKDIVAFLDSLTGKFPTLIAPRLPQNNGEAFDVTR